jgi:hypothetical protein
MGGCVTKKSYVIEKDMPNDAAESILYCSSMRYKGDIDCLFNVATETIPLDLSVRKIARSPQERAERNKVAMETLKDLFFRIEAMWSTSGFEGCVDCAPFEDLLHRHDCLFGQDALLLVRKSLHFEQCPDDRQVFSADSERGDLFDIVLGFFNAGEEAANLSIRIGESTPYKRVLDPLAIVASLCGKFPLPRSHGGEAKLGIYSSTCQTGLYSIHVELGAGYTAFARALGEVDVLGSPETVIPHHWGAHDRGRADPLTVAADRILELPEIDLQTWRVRASTTNKRLESYKRSCWQPPGTRIDCNGAGTWTKPASSNRCPQPK